jgi:hypothetical protein
LQKQAQAERRGGRAEAKDRARHLVQRGHEGRQIAFADFAKSCGLHSDE